MGYIISLVLFIIFGFNAWQGKYMWQLLYIAALFYIGGIFDIFVNEYKKVKSVEIGLNSLKDNKYINKILTDEFKKWLNENFGVKSHG